MKLIRVEATEGNVRRVAQLSDHGQTRVAQRNLSDRDLAEVLRLGRRIRRTGALFVFLARRDLPAARENDRRLLRLVGTTLILSADGKTLITAYRDPGALRKICKKSKRRRPHGALLGLAA